MTKARDLANGGFGLILIKPSSVVNGTDNGKGTISFSGVTSFSLNNVFSATYDNYRIVMNLDAGTSNTFITFRLRVSGADNTTASYNDMRGWDRATSFTQTSAQIALNNNSAEGCAVMDIFRPFEVKVTNAISWFHGRTTSAVDAYNFHATQSQSLSFDGITFINAGNMTGTVSVYGYNK